MPFPDVVVAGDYLIRNAIKSQNYLAGVDGWAINADGSAEFNQLSINFPESAVPGSTRVVLGGTVPPELAAQGYTVIIERVFYAGFGLYYWRAIRITGGILEEINSGFSDGSTTFTLRSETANTVGLSYETSMAPNGDTVFRLLNRVLSVENRGSADVDLGGGITTASAAFVAVTGLATKTYTKRYNSTATRVALHGAAFVSAAPTGFELGVSFSGGPGAFRVARGNCQTAGQHFPISGEIKVAPFASGIRTVTAMIRRYVGGGNVTVDANDGYTWTVEEVPAD